MNLTKQLLWGTLAAVAAHGLSSCSDNDSPAEAPSFSYKVIANAQTAYGDTAKAAGKTTLALTESAGQLLSAFTSGEKLIGFNLTSDGSGENTAATFSTLSADKAGYSSSFTGTIVGTRAPQMGDEFAFFYPATGTEAGSYKSITPVKQELATTLAEEKELIYQTQSTIKKTVELNLTKQDGTLPTINQRFDYQWGKATPTEVTSEGVQIEVGKLNRKIALWGLRFTDPNNRPFTNIDSINISEIKGSEILDLGTGEFVTDNKDEELWGISLFPGGTKKFSSANGKYVYVALLPGSYKDVIVTVYAGGKIYQREYPTLNFTADHFYKTDILQIEEWKAKPYVNVEGVNWATGNFIRYNKGITEYWGIAPTQWWVSQYYFTDSNGQPSGSQVATNINGDDDDNDLFRFGDIEFAHIFNKDLTAKIGTMSIEKKWYTARGGIAQETTDINQAKYGDLVWRHTKNKKEQYRYPTDLEIYKLKENAHVIASFCYTNKGTKIYGAYFYDRTPGDERIVEFPVRRKTLDTFRNVTNLVRANKGLFLPIVGYRNPIGGNIVYRNVNNGTATSRYHSSKGMRPTTSYNEIFEFGARYFGSSALLGNMSKAIRPVWVGTNANPTDPISTHIDFNGLN